MRSARRDSAASGLHLTRRGWIVLVALPLALLAAVLLVVSAFFTSQAQAAGSGGDVTTTVEVSVASGETLWTLAAEYAPERDPRAVVEEIVELNALASSTVQAGQSLHIPVGGR
jgi:LysM repeat protein